MTVLRHFVFGTVLVITILAVAVVFRWFRTSDEIGSKPEASVIQTLEMKYRNQPMTPKLVVQRKNGYDAVGIVAKDGRERVWLLLNAKHPPLVKLSSPADYQLTPTDIEWLKGQCQISDAVYQTLERHAQ